MPFLARLGKLDHKATRISRTEKPLVENASSAAVQNPANLVQPTSQWDNSESKKKASDSVKDERAKPTPANGGRGGPTSGHNNITRSQMDDFISKATNRNRQGLKPSGPELFAYARYLGIDPVADHDLLWIAEEALEAPLPSNWTEHFDNNDRIFYYNATTRVSSWTHPLEHAYRDAYKDIVNFRNANLPQPEQAERLQALQKSVKQMDAEVHSEILQWKEYADEQGNRFYFNRDEGLSTWTDPRPAKCQLLCLRMKTLNVLLMTSRSHGSNDRDAKTIARGSEGSEEEEADANHCSTGATCDTSTGSDGDSVVVKRKKKKKKKKNKPDTSPTRPCVQNLRASQSEPIVGPKSLVGSESHSSLHQASAVSLGFDNSESLNTVGRTRVRAGVRLEPITSTKQCEFLVMGTLDKSNRGSKSAPSIP